SSSVSSSAWAARRRSDRATSPRPLLADSHVHLDRYAPPLLRAMLGRARQAGVRRFLTIGVDEATSAAAVTLARERRGVRAAIGVHPGRVGGLDLKQMLARLRPLAGQPRVVAVGEVGLDETSRASAADQEAFFAAFIELALEQQLALSLHVIGRHRRAQHLLGRDGAGRAVVHYFQ